MTTPRSPDDLLRLLELRLSHERLASYVTEAGGDLNDGLHLYTWNTEMSGAMWEDLGLVEVLLRNTVDHQLATRYTNRGYPGSWFANAGRELPRPAQQDIAVARSRLTRQGKLATHGQMVSAMTFGFWRYFFSRRYTNLWPDIASGFPYAPDRALKTLEAPIDRLHKFRNRIGHHQRIWAEPLGARHQDMLNVVGYIDPRLANCLSTTSRFHVLHAARPLANQ